MTTTELYVGLKIPDNAAITAFNALHRMGFHRLKNLERQDYYKFEFNGDKKKLEKQISQVDILVNANKHSFSFKSEKNDKNDSNYVKVLVQGLGGDSGLLKVLKERLGFKNLKKVEKGILWTMNFSGVSDKSALAEKIAKSLLMNENYQKFKIL